MQSSDTKPDSFTFACLARACSEKFDIKGLRSLHASMVVSGFGLDSICSSALVSAYSKLGHTNEAGTVFCGILEPDLVLWNSMISGYGSGGNPSKGLELFNRMRKLGERPDGYTIVGLVVGLTDPNLVPIGELIHGFCLKSGFDSNNHVNSALVSMYSRFKCMVSACKLFSNLSQPDLVTWSSLITGFSLSGEHAVALDFFRDMTMEGKRPDHVLIASALAGAAQIAIVKPGIEIHGYAIRHGMEFHVLVSSALIDMYAKCGFLDSSIKVFKIMPERNIISYNSIISILGLYGLANEAFLLFEEVLQDGLKPDENTFAAILGACCHSGLVDAGREYMRRMKDEFSISAKTEHYVFLVKLLGMAGELKEGYELIQSLEEPVDSGIWGALLSCCNVHGNHEMAEIVADNLSKSENYKSSYEVMLCNAYASDGRWDDVQKIRADSKALKWKVPGISWIADVN
ncbi:OLC1v1016498C1 [Oldenlandia corymbosa var. corymbosa]|uniref:OLC1v1016498C1 n=1 Tax=Oldenlandia corymbosa var. corymbosa TaxID=529605 RepID=A0AAV1E7H4_OLDCO|nr:OLC1v1016498C1 [Oldenlandia corymbosa var. corymbosa]